MFEARPYQTAAIDANLACYDAGNRRMIDVMATGTGKTVVFSKMYEAMKSRLPGQMLVLAHTEELVKQNTMKMQVANPGLKVGIEMAGFYADPQSDIISASVATLGRAGSKRPDRFNWGSIDKVVIDEAHHSVTEAYGRVLDLAGSLKPETHKLLLGVTATSQRMDGKALSDIYERVAYVYPLRQAIKESYLVPIRGFRVTTNTKLSDVGVGESGDYVVSALSKAVATDARNSCIVTEWLKLAGDRKTVTFAVDIEHARSLAAEFGHRGVSAAAVWGDDPDRGEKLNAHKNGNLQVLVNCAVLVEGYDDPSISCVVLARPTQSSVLFSQMVGRGTRTCAGKVDLLVLDVVDSSVSHSLVTLPTLMGLSNGLDVKGKGIVEVAELLEAAQEAHPSIDLSTLDDIDKLTTVVQQIDMMEVRFPKEVEANSDMIWYRAADGGYKISIPKIGEHKAGFMHIRENMLGQWTIEGRIMDVDLVATRPSMEESFKACDEQIRKRIDKMHLSYLLREATWHSKPVTAGQQKLLKRLFPKRQFPFAQMTSGMASKIINERLNKK